MAFNGTLLKLGTYEFPLEHINAESFKAQIITQDVDSNYTATGWLKRNVVEHQPIKISFELEDGITNTELAPIMASIRNNYVTTEHTQQEKKLNAKVYIPELDDYVTQQVYMKSDIEFPIDYIEGTVIYYKPITLAFVGY